MKLAFFGVEYVECHREQIAGGDFRVFRADCTFFDGSPGVSYVAVPADYFGADVTAVARYEKEVPAGLTLTQAHWVKLPQLIAASGVEVC